MGSGREARESEKVFEQVWSMMRRLCCCVWHGGPLVEDAAEDVGIIKERLDEVIRLMSEERRKEQP